MFDGISYSFFVKEWNEILVPSKVWSNICVSGLVTHSQILSLSELRNNRIISTGLYSWNWWLCQSVFHSVILWYFFLTWFFKSLKLLFLNSYFQRLMISARKFSLVFFGHTSNIMYDGDSPFKPEVQFPPLSIK